jgi:hypothetical protein
MSLEVLNLLKELRVAFDQVDERTRVCAAWSSKRKWQRSSNRHHRGASLPQCSPFRRVLFHTSQQRMNVS